MSLSHKDAFSLYKRLYDQYKIYLNNAAIKRKTERRYRKSKQSRRLSVHALSHNNALKVLGFQDAADDFILIDIFTGAGDGNRTRVTSLEGWSSTIELHPHIKNGRDDRIRTCDILLPKQARYQTAPHPDVLTHYNKLKMKRSSNLANGIIPI